MQKVHLKRTKRLLAGHLWVFSNELHESPRSYLPGSLVEVYDMRDMFIGTGYINPNSLISIRLLTKEKVVIDAGFLKKRIDSAVAMRRRFVGEIDAVRLVYSEGDFLPGLIVDRYADCLVVQILTYGMEELKDTIIGILDDMLSPKTILLRNDSRSRSLEGLPLYKEVSKGNPDDLPVIDEDGVRLEVNPYEGQKTGYFLDQKANRRFLRGIISGGSGLDLFCYTGAWSMHLATSGAEVIGVDSSERAISLAEKNAGLNGLQDKVKFVKEDVFSFLKGELSNGEKRYDFIVLDPPAFVKSSGRIKEAVKAYRELNEVCMRLIRPGGILATSSCSYHLGREMFLDMIGSAGRDSGRDLRLLALRSQDIDHPVVLAMPETEYLKCAFVLVN
ncbi:MAG: class I SAM-dependent rRNA methyltransferase [Nitrospirae bacterium]|nr:class I SAM-dependent rRNA methyltransferase [Nitrospirota bacterium]